MKLGDGKKSINCARLICIEARPGSLNRRPGPARFIGARPGPVRPAGPPGPCWSLALTSSTAGKTKMATKYVRPIATASNFVFIAHYINLYFATRAVNCIQVHNNNKNSQVQNSKELHANHDQRQKTIIHVMLTRRLLGIQQTYQIEL